MNVNTETLYYINITSENISFDLKYAFKLSYSVSQALVAWPKFANGKSQLPFNDNLLNLRNRTKTCIS